MEAARAKMGDTLICHSLPTTRHGTHIQQALIGLKMLCVNLCLPSVVHSLVLDSNVVLWRMSEEG